MHIRSASPADEASFCSLWQRAFGDSEEFARFVFTRYAGSRHIYIAEEGGVFAAMLCAIPGSLGDHPGVYLYGLATEPEFRRQGIMSALIEWTCRAERTRSAQFALLVPAGSGLFDYYAKRGFRTAFYRCVELIPRPARPAPVCTVRAPRAAAAEAVCQQSEGIGIALEIGDVGPFVIAQMGFQRIAFPFGKIGGYGIFA